jgi:outer membrane protein insertion porin family
MKRLLVAAVVLVAPAGAFADEATGSPTVESAPARKPTGWFSVGAGYNPDDGFLATAGIGQDDLFHTGHRLTLTSTLSAIRQEAVLAYEIPQVLGTGFDLKTELFARDRTYPDFTRKTAGGAVTVGRKLDRATRIYARYQVEHVTMEPAGLAVARTSSLPATGLLGEGVLQTVGAGIIYDTRDSPSLPRHGTYLELSGDHSLGADYRMMRANAALQHARPLGPFTLRASGRASYVHSTDPLGVPLAFRLQHDGHTDVRGYSLDAGSFPGSNVEALGRVEVELPIWKRAGLSIAGWADAGFSYNTDPAWGAGDPTVRRSVGFSIIWRSPIGPLQFDWAVPLDGDKRDRQFLFSLGGMF